jgi:uncharacterized protein (TIGR02611 family)
MPARHETTDEVDGEHTRVTGGSHAVAPVDLARDADPPESAAADELLSEASHDRWHWRRKIRANPVQRKVYRLVVGVAGLLLIVLGLVTGPIPGPGGIPLILLGLATWASEFAWAHRLMQVFKAQLKRFQSWNRWQQTAFWLVFVACCGLFGYGFMLALGIPAWVPAAGDNVLERLPGL